MGCGSSSQSVNIVHGSASSSQPIAAAPVLTHAVSPVPSDPTDNAILLPNSNAAWLHSLSAKSRSLDLSNRAISLKWLYEHFLRHDAAKPSHSAAAAAAEKQWSPSLSSGEFVKQIVIPKTASSQCSLAELLPPSCCGRADYFISYSWWAQSMQELISSIIQFVHPVLAEQLRKEKADVTYNVPDVFVWIDTFAVNQHGGAKQADDLLNLGDVIKNASRGTILVTFRMSRFDALRRAWCLFEMSQTLRIHGRDSLHFANRDVLDNSFVDAFVNLSLSNAEASLERDRLHILQELRESSIGEQGHVLALRHGMSNAAVRTFTDNLFRLLEVEDRSQAFAELVDMIRMALDLRMMLPDESQQSSETHPSSDSQTSASIVPSPQIFPLSWTYKYLDHDAHSIDSQRREHLNFAVARLWFIESVTNVLPRTFRAADATKVWSSHFRSIKLLRAPATSPDEETEQILQQSQLAVKVIEDCRDNPSELTANLETLKALGRDSDFRLVLADCGGVETVVSVIGQYRTNLKLSTLACEALGNLAAHPLTQGRVIHSGAVQEIISILNWHQQSELVKAASACLRNMMLDNADNRAILCAVGAADELHRLIRGQRRKWDAETTRAAQGALDYMTRGSEWQPAASPYAAAI